MTFLRIGSKNLSNFLHEVKGQQRVKSGQNRIFRKKSLGPFLGQKGPKWAQNGPKNGKLSKMVEKY